jgi:hypothetical protein
MGYDGKSEETEKARPTDQKVSAVFGMDYSKIHSKKVLEKLEKLQNYSYPPAARVRLKEKFPFADMDDEDIELCITEFKRYVALRIINRYEKNNPHKNNGPTNANATVAMTSEIIDEVWHSLILFTKDYHEFSLLVYGEYLHHLPSIAEYSSPITDNDVKAFIKAYKEYFGPISPIWYYKINKNVKDNFKHSASGDNSSSSSSGVSNNNNLTDEDAFSSTHGDTLQAQYPGPRSENMFARIDANTFLYYLSMDSEIYSVESRLQITGFTDIGNMVCTYPDECNDSGDGGSDGGGCGGCGGCG